MADHNHHHCHQHPPSPHLLLCPSPSPIFNCVHRRRHRLCLPPTSTVFCLIVVCCWSSSLFVLMLSPFSSSRSSPAPTPHSSAPATIFLSSLFLLSRLFDCCMHPRRIRRMLFLLRGRITNVQSGHCHCRHHLTVVTVAAAPVSTPRPLPPLLSPFIPRCC